MNMKRFIGAASAALLLFGVASPSLTANVFAQEKVKLTFWDENAGPQRTPLWEELIERFEKENPDIDVEYVGLPKNEAKAKIDAAIAANDAPDVASLQSTWLPEFSIRGALLPLNDMYEASVLKDKINEQAMEFNQSIVQDGMLYGIPYTQNLDVLWIRSDIFAKNNLEAPKSWDDFFKDIELLTKDDMYGYTLRGGAGGALHLQRLMYAYSGIEEYITEDGKITINDPLHKEFLERYIALYNVNTPQSDISNGYKEMVATFDSGLAAIVHHNIGSFGEHSEALKPEQFEAVPLPASLKGNYVLEGGNAIGLSIFKNTKHPKEAFRLLEFLASEESQSHWNEAVGQIPTHKDTLDDEWIQNAQHISVAFDVYNNPETKLYQPPFYLPDYRSTLDNLVDPNIQKLLAGDMSVDDFLDEWASALEKSNAKYKEVFKD
ncbi:sugar ABC transporter substrate-binding protein [Aerococcaceae bacterium zg-ZUI334]|uniref:ABC transporter substrate-binding protein n=1 Tax=Aerococcaceae TaxID=186827 RepID=UPI0013BE446C|nr:MULTISPECIES: sugar ABC transporter substrate-binding protein [unclassified Facklamia]MBR7927630.1 sugar ABC transporter substrate-binding protein [Aerococcaceae bacterium zg-ZUI334]MBS4462182.1 sugar ABC transporter substrate-binding protein [Aerococcaceae bacterium zg-B36]QQD65453.1 sugar ABC transporter substrate-binding protein [Aerococcaceae bacterium zg-252]NEW64641.1 extracellular solute-binding protein [Facklamia sp. 252]NEW67966.1 extracellular solute-binding protein [Facklamia sp.